MDAYVTRVVDYLLSQSWQIAVLAIAVALVTFLLRNKSAHVRYLLWLVVLAKCLVPPLYAVPLRVLAQDALTVQLSGPESRGADTDAATTPVTTYAPPISEATATPVEGVSASERPGRDLSSGDSQILPSLTQGPGAAATTGTHEPRGLTWADAQYWFGIIWLAGVCSYLAVNVLKALGTRRWLRRDRRPLQADLQAEVSEFFSARGFGRLPRIWVIEDVNQPFVWGLLRGDVYLPAGLLSVDRLEQQKNVLGHELSHVVRFDAAVSLFQVIVQAMFWFHPFVWWANLWIRREREKCCDEMTVAGLSTQPKDYSKAIVEALTLGRRSSRRLPSLAIAGSITNLEQRIRAILRPGRRFYRRPSFLLISAVLLIAAVIVPAALVPQYRARGEIRIRPIIPRLVLRTDGTGPVPFYESFVNTQVAVMKSPDVLNRVLERTDVQQTKWYSEPERSLKQRLARQADTHMERLKDALSVQRRRDTEIVDVSFSCASARDAVAIVNSVLEQYVKYAEEASDRTRDDVFRLLMEEYKRLRSEIAGQVKIIYERRRSLGTTEPEQLIAAKRLRLDDMQARLTELRRRITLLEFQIDRVNASDSDEEAAAPPGVESRPQYHADPKWRKLYERVITLRHKIASSPLASKHPSSVQIQKDLEFAETSLRLREEQLDQQWRDRADDEIISIASTPDIGVDDAVEEVTSLEDRLALAREAERLLTEELKKQQQEFKDLFEAAQLLEKEIIVLEHKRGLFDAVRQRLDKTRMERNAPCEISIFSRASALPKPHSGRFILYVGIALGLCLIVGRGIVFLQSRRVGDVVK